MILTIASSDKVTLSMFLDFYRTLYDANVKIFDLNCLFSPEIISNVFNTLTSLNKTGDNFLVKFKVKVKIKKIPPLVIDLSDIVLNFDIFSLKPEIIKSNGSQTSAIIDRWEKNIDRLNK